MRLLGLVLAMAGIATGQRVGVLSRAMRLKFLHVLRCSEAATRRLIVIAARGVSVRLRPVRPVGALPPAKTSPAARAPVFALLDPLRRVGLRPAQMRGYGPRIRGFGPEDEVFHTPPMKQDDDPLDVAPLLRRAVALQSALADIPREAKRLARWHARRLAGRRRGRVLPLRTGRPPGYRARGRDAVDDVLRNCHELALYAMAAPDTG